MKLLVTADVHIHDYPNYNIDGPDFRLQQFIKLAHRQVDLFKKHKCTSIQIAGDLVQVAIIKPHIQHVVFDYVEILAEAVGEVGGEVLISGGNHDFNSKSLAMSDNQSIVTLLNRLPNVRFMNKVVEEFEGLKIGFQNWLPEHSLDWYEGEIDILFNHYTDVGPGWNGQTIDNTRFGVMFFGDIHKSYRKGNMVSIGTPIGHRLGDQMDGKVIILDLHGNEGTETQDTPNGKVSWDWVDIIEPGVWDFLRIYRPDKKPVNAGEYKYDIEVPYAVRSDKKDESDLVAGIDVQAIMKKKVAEHHVEDIHQRVIAEVGGAVSEPVNMNFQLIKMEVNNYRSIDHFELEFRGGVTLMTGEPGAGKTSVIRALEFAFNGDRLIRDQIRNTAEKGDDLSVDVILKYNGNYIRINRGPGYNYCWKGDQTQVMVDSYVDEKSDQHYNMIEHHGANEGHKVILGELGFLKHWNLLYINQFSSGLFASMNTNQRIEMLASILGWEVVQDYNRAATALLQDDKQKIIVMQKDVEKLLAQIEVIEDMDLNWDDRDYDEEISGVNKSVDEIKRQEFLYSEAKRMQSDIDNKLSQFQIYDGASAPKTRLAYVENVDEEYTSVCIALGKIDELKQAINDQLAGDLHDQIQNLNKEQIILTKTWDGIRDEFNELISSTQSKLDNLENSRSMMKLKKDAADKLVAEKLTKINDLQGRIESLKKDHETVDLKGCSHCGQVLPADKLQEHKDMIASSMLTVETTLKEVQKQFVNATTEANAIEVPDIVEAATTYNDEIAQLKLKRRSAEVQYKKDVEEVQAKTQLVNDQAKVAQEKLGTLNVHRQEIEQYLKLKQLARDLDQEIGLLQADLESYKSANAVPTSEKMTQLRTDLDKLHSQIGELEAQKKQAIINNEQLLKLKTMKDTVEELERCISEDEALLAPLEEYIALTANEGSVVRSVLESCAAMLSNDKLQVETTKELRSGEIRPDLTLSMKVGTKFIPYHNLSGGQLFTADIRFLLSIIEVCGGTGLLMLDEAFKYLSSDHINDMAEDIECCGANDCIVITHNDNYPQYHTRISARLDEDGISQYMTQRTE